MLLSKGQKVVKKRKVLKEKKVEVSLKDLNENDEFLQDKNNRDEDEVVLNLSRYCFFYLGTACIIQDYIKKCIEFDIANSKLSRVIKDPMQLDKFKIMMVRHYKDFKDAFYYLANDNPNLQGLFSIN